MKFINIQDAKECGCQNILALRGDPPRGQEHWEACENGFSHAIDLVRYIRQQYGDYFGIAVAGYCEGHVDNPDKVDDLCRLKEKVDAGADFIITQVFYDVDLFLEWVKKCRSIGISCPILPGLLPIQNYTGFNRIVTLSKTIVPQFVLEELEPIKDDDAAVKEYGIKLAVDMIRKMFADGIRGYHFYTMNLERSTRLILEALEFVPPIENVKPLPWCPVSIISFFNNHICMFNSFYYANVVSFSKAQERKCSSHILEKPHEKLYCANGSMG